MGVEFRINERGEIIREHNSQPQSEEKNPKRNWWQVVSAVLFVVLCLLAYGLYEANERADYLQRRVHYLNAENEAIEHLHAQLEAKNTMISEMERRLPQNYYTKYPNQGIYYWDGSFVRANSFWPDANICLTVYLQKDGYGMTEYGWVPMSCLRKKND